VLIVFPTMSTVARWRPLLTFLLAALLHKGDRLRLHLHEYRIFREVRWALGAVMLVGRPTVVVSSRSEQELLDRTLAGRLGRLRSSVIPPFGPLPPSSTGASAIDAAGTGIVGVFGSPGPAKGLDLVLDVVRSLPAGYSRLELVGSGWPDVTWPADIAERLDIVPLGFVPSRGLGEVFARWELALAPFSEGASDGRSSLRIPLSHGVPTVTQVRRAQDLTLAPCHLVLLGDDAATATRRAVALAADPEARRRGALEVDEFERDVRKRLRVELLGTEFARYEPSTLVAHGEL
jgi:hypothetical protein